MICSTSWMHTKELRGVYYLLNIYIYIVRLKKIFNASYSEIPRTIMTMFMLMQCEYFEGSILVTKTLVNNIVPALRKVLKPIGQVKLRYIVRIK